MAKRKSKADLLAAVQISTLRGLLSSERIENDYQRVLPKEFLGVIEAEQGEVELDAVLDEIGAAVGVDPTDSDEMVQAVRGVKCNAICRKIDAILQQRAKAVDTLGLVDA